ncbi:MAG: SDR family NAD(P)-dependent oxidoreductase [Pseudomonadota bacterium]
MLEPIRRAVVIGANGGIGAAFVTALATRSDTIAVYAGARRDLGSFECDSVIPFVIDIGDEASVVAAADGIGGELDAVIVATGTLHGATHNPEKSWRDIDAAALAEVYRVNTIGPTLVAKHFLPRLHRKQRAIFAALSARVGSISDNRLGGWYAYRASKAALNMLIRSLSIEFARRNRNGIVIGLHPGTVDTALSKPFQANVPAGKLFSTDTAAGQLLAVIDAAGPSQTGQCFAWDGQVITP